MTRPQCGPGATKLGEKPVSSRLMLCSVGRRASIVGRMPLDIPYKRLRLSRTDRAPDAVRAQIEVGRCR